MVGMSNPPTRFLYPPKWKLRGGIIVLYLQTFAAGVDRMSGSRLLYKHQSQKTNSLGRRSKVAGWSSARLPVLFSRVSLSCAHREVSITCVNGFWDTVLVFRPLLAWVVSIWVLRWWHCDIFCWGVCRMMVINDDQFLGMAEVAETWHTFLQCLHRV